MFREYKIQRGKFEGTHKVYLHPDYWREDYPDSQLKKWLEDTEFAQGDWVQSMDGFVVQILSVTNLKSNLKVKFIRFPMGTMTFYQKKDGGYKYSNFYAMMSAYDKGSVTGQPIRQNSEKKIKFAYLVAQGMDLVQAYQQAFKWEKFKQIFAIKREIAYLLKDDLVRSTLMNELKPFTDKLNEVITEDQIIEHLELLLAKSRQGSQNHRENIKFIMELKGMIAPQNNKRIIEDANYKEIPPPQLPS